LIEGERFDSLVASIREHGLRRPITMYQSKILDGRQRFRACLAAGVEPRFEEYTGDDPVGFVTIANLMRHDHTPEEIKAGLEAMDTVVEARRSRDA
jgi:ParB-like chromosome segregation protein Spo0J